MDKQRRFRPAVRLWRPRCTPRRYVVMGLAVVVFLLLLLNHSEPTSQPQKSRQPPKPPQQWPQKSRQPPKPPQQSPQSRTQPNTARTSVASQPSPPLSASPTLTPRSVCVESGNARVVSIFRQDMLGRYGSGRYHYHWAGVGQRCSRSNGAVVSMLFQKYLAVPANLARAVKTADLLIVQGDEHCNCPVTLCGPKVPVRQYYGTQYAASARPPLYLALGPRHEFKLVGRDEMAAHPFASRRYLLNMMVSPTTKARRSLAERLAGLNELTTTTLFRENEVFINVANTFKNDITAASGHVTPEQYRDVLLDSRFTLCPGGKNPEAYRIFEAVEAGSVPILALDKEYHAHRCKDAFRPLLNSGAPFVWLDSWDDLPRTLEEVVANPLALEQRHRDLIEWRNTYWDGVSREFEALLDRALDSRSTPVGSTTVSKAAASHAPLLTGCGRSGTLSVRDMLLQLGIAASHEQYFPTKVAVSWLYAATQDSRYPFESADSAARRAQSLQQFGPVAQLVRHPLRVISSTRRCFCGRGTRETGLGAKSDRRSWTFVEKHLDLQRYLPGVQWSELPLDDVRRSMVYWVGWNELILEQHAETHAGIFRLEDLRPSALVYALEVQDRADSQILKNLSSVPRSAHHDSSKHSKGGEAQQYPVLSWSDLHHAAPALAQEVWDLAQRFGYDEGELPPW